MAQSDTSRADTSAQSGSSAQGFREGTPTQLDQAATALQTRLGDEATNLGSEAKQLAEDAAGRARDVAQDRFSSGKDRAARSLGTVADALRHTGQHLRLQDEESLPGYIDRAAETLESVSGYLRDKELRDVVFDVESFARREPAIFIGGAFAVGLLGGRFLKSSSSRGSNGEASSPNDEAAPKASSARLAGRSPQRQNGPLAPEQQAEGTETASNDHRATNESGGASNDARSGDA